MSVKSLTRTAIIAALYVALCLVLAPISFGPVQIRVAEALTLLPVVCPQAIVGVTLGCFLANFIASAPVDMVVGTAATLVAALLTRRLAHLRVFGLAVWASVPPVLINAVVVGAMLTILYVSPTSPAGVYAFNMLTVGIGQLISCTVLGTLLVFSIEKNSALRNFFSQETNNKLKQNGG